MSYGSNTYGSAPYAGESSTTTDTTVTGVTTGLALAAPAGSVSLEIAGAVTGLTFASPAGSVSIAVAGTPSGLTLAAPTGAVSLQLAGTVADLALAAPAGSVSTGITDVVVAGVVTGFTLSAPAGSAPSTSPQGGQTKPRRHLGLAPGPREQHGETNLLYRLHMVGHGTLQTGTELSLPAHAGRGAAEFADHRDYRRDTASKATVETSDRLDFPVGRATAGILSEDPDEFLVLLTIGD